MRGDTPRDLEEPATRPSWLFAAGRAEGESFDDDRLVELDVTFDGRKWVFSATGTEQPFEEAETYRAPRVRDRFTSEMLERYCNALGIDVFNADAYGPDSVFVETQGNLPPEAVVMTLVEAQDWLEVRPGTANTLPG